MDSLSMDHTREEVNFFYVGLVSLGGRVRRVGPLRNDLHDHQLRCTRVHPLHVLLLHTPVMMRWVMVGAARSSARSIGLVEILGVLHDLFGPELAAYTTIETPEALL